MKKVEWLACSDTKRMLAFLRGKMTGRQMQLWAYACCRRVWHLLADERSRLGLDAAERYTEGHGEAEQLRQAHRAAHEAANEATDALRLEGTRRGDRAALEGAAHSASWVVSTALQPMWGCDPFTDLTTSSRAVVASWALVAVEEAADKHARAAEETAQADLLRDIRGDPYRRKGADPDWLSWQGGLVTHLAEAAYDGRELPSGHLEVARLAVLADALEDAGCSEAALLSHLRGEGPHVRGCWAVDLILGKE